MCKTLLRRAANRELGRRAVFWLVLVLCTGCFHYTPSREEMEESGDKSLAGPEVFQAYQNDLRSRLDKLVKDRSPLLEQRNELAYQVDVGDTLKIDVFGFPDLSGEMPVSEDGNISLPLIGAVYVKDKSIARIQGELTAQFLKFVRNPKVRVEVDAYNAHRVSVVGSVAKPGWYPLKRPGYLLTELLAEAGGTKEDGANRVYLIPANSAHVASDANVASAGVPGIPGGSAGVEINLDQLVGTLDTPPILIPLVSGDTVIVPSAGQFRVDGEVEHPGSFPVSPRTSTLSAVASAGGFTYAANVNQVEVIRDIGAGKKASMTVDLEKVAFQGTPDLSLRDGDVVIVPSSPGRFRARQLVEAFRSVFRGGVTGSVRYQ